MPGGEQRCSVLAMDRQRVSVYSRMVLKAPVVFERMNLAEAISKSSELSVRQIQNVFAMGNGAGRYRRRGGCGSHSSRAQIILTPR